MAGPQPITGWLQHGGRPHGLGGSLMNALFTRGRTLREALLLAEDPPGVEDLGDGVVASGLIPDLPLIPKPWKIDGYSTVIEKLGSMFELTDGENFFPFPYDWRRDNRVAARQLARLSHDRLAYRFAHKTYVVT
jgi:hypothetical protein